MKIFVFDEMHFFIYFLSIQSLKMAKSLSFRGQKGDKQFYQDELPTDLSKSSSYEVKLVSYGFVFV